MKPPRRRSLPLATQQKSFLRFSDFARAGFFLLKGKENFFDESPIGFIASPFGWGLIVAMYLLAGIVGLIYRAILKRYAKGTVRLNKNIGKRDRLIRAAIGIGLLLWAITTTWSPILIFFSGFAIFESIFSWCAVYQLMGKNTCDI